MRPVANTRSLLNFICQCVNISTISLKCCNTIQEVFMLIKAAILSVCLLIPLQSHSEQCYLQKKCAGLEIRVNPFMGEHFDFNFDFSANFPNLQLLSIASGSTLEEHFKNSTDDLGLSKNHKLQQLRIKDSKHFVKVLSQSKLTKLKSLYICCPPFLKDWNFLSVFHTLESLEIECADNINFTHLLKNVYNLTQLKAFSVFFDDYITHESTRPSSKQISLLASLSHLESLTLKYYRILDSEKVKSEESFYKELEKTLIKNLPNTAVTVELIEFNITSS